jgi:STE24 endopeptidase
MTWFGILVLLLVLLRAAGQIVLERLNRGHVQAHAKVIPPAFQNVVDPATYAKAVDYTLAKSRFHVVEILYATCLLLMVIFSGVLPWAYSHVNASSAWANAAFLLAIGLGLSLLSLPLDYYSQFRLEERFGFNTMSTRLWWVDHLKGWLLTIALGLPLLWLILKFVDWTGQAWWILAWASLVIFQLLMVLLAPIIIMPLFNKFEPLPEGSLRERLLRLASRTGFRTQSIQVMDGSKRSRHSNAFFTGFGNFRKIVLFDTLITQLQEVELEAVLAHEIGHYKKKHIPKMLAASALGSLVGFYLVSLLAQQAWFSTSFGFPAGNITATLLLFGLLSGVVGFWISPIAHWFSRKYEYQADAFAAKVMQESESLINALHKLAEKNLSNLTPHPVYSGFYYSHPTLLERESALRKV